MDAETVLLTAVDGMKVAGTYYPSISSIGLILLHMYKKNRHTFDDFAQEANKKGFAVISIDMRGHGDSEGELDNFAELDFQKMEEDAVAAKAYLLSKGVKRVYVIGASIGANIAINFAAHESDAEGAVALSPSRNYHGISTVESIEQFSKRLFIASASGDLKSYNDSLFLIGKATGKNHFEKIDNDLHGTNFLDRSLTDKILKWIK